MRKLVSLSPRVYVMRVVAAVCPVQTRFRGDPTISAAYKYIYALGALARSSVHVPELEKAADRNGNAFRRSCKGDYCTLTVPH